MDIFTNNRFISKNQVVHVVPCFSFVDLTCEETLIELDHTGEEYARKDFLFFIIQRTVVAEVHIVTRNTDLSAKVMKTISLLITLFCCFELDMVYYRSHTVAYSSCAALKLGAGA